ncbi:MAG: toll/interleukin-1 receptor domain-containing protein [Rhodoferax sp.]
MNAAGPPPPNVFVSYAREDRPLAEQLAHALSASGLQVWWDRDLAAGSEFTAVIEAKLLGAAVVIVLWSADSVRSSYERDESSGVVNTLVLLKQVRVQGKSDRSYARWVSKAVSEALNAPPAISGLHNARPRTDTYEIWLGRSLCAPGGLQLAGCKGAS